MSVHDETWDKCPYCKQTIKSYHGRTHDNGKCLIYDDKQENIPNHSINMPKSKNIIRVNDIVEITNPEVFVRCGYPLTTQIIKDAFTDEQWAATDIFLKKHFDIAQYEPIPFLPDTMKDKGSLDNVMTAIAIQYMKEKKWGGTERKIYTVHNPELLGHSGTVINKRVVKTGNYESGGGGYGYDGEYDYEPAYLSECKTHVILTIRRDWRDIEIEQKNVKLLDKKSDEELWLQIMN